MNNFEANNTTSIPNVYEAPSIEVIEVKVEQGFQGSDPSKDEDGGSW